MQSQYTYDNVTCLDTFKKNRKKRINIHKNMNFIAVFLLLFLLIVILFLMSPFLNVASIDVQGANICNKQDIINNCGINFSDNIFRINKKNVAQYLTSVFSYIDTVRISVHFPDKVTIKIVERQAVGMIAYMGAYIIVDKNGNALEAVDINTDKGLAVIKGINIAGFQLGHMIPAENTDNFNAAVNIVKLLIKYNLLYRVNSIDVQDIQNIHLTIEDNVMANVSGIQDIDYKISCLNEIIKKIGTDKKGYIDFTAADNPIFIPED